MPKAGWISKKRRSWPEGHRACTICKEIKPYSEFHKHSNANFIGGIIPQCKVCRNIVARQRQQATSVEYKLFCAAKARAKEKELEFNITIEDIKIPAYCPVFGYKMVYNSPTAPSIDRIDSNKGYTPENIQVISKRANMLKGNATLEEIKKLYEFMSHSHMSGYCEVL